MTLDEFLEVQECNNCIVEIKSFYDDTQLYFEEGQTARVSSFDIDYDSREEVPILTIKVADKKLYIERLKEKRDLVDKKIKKL